MDVLYERLASPPQLPNRAVRRHGSLGHELDRIGRLDEVPVLGAHLIDSDEERVEGAAQGPWSAALSASRRPQSPGEDRSPAAPGRSWCAEAPPQRFPACRG